MLPWSEELHIPGIWGPFVKNHRALNEIAYTRILWKLNWWDHSVPFAKTLIYFKQPCLRCFILCFVLKVLLDLWVWRTILSTPKFEQVLMLRVHFSLLVQPFGKRHRAVPTTFHGIRIDAISFWTLGNFPQKVLIPREYLVPQFRLTLCRILLFLSCRKYIFFRGFPLKSCALRLRKCIPWDYTLVGLLRSANCITINMNK